MGAARLRTLQSCAGARDLAHESDNGFGGRASLSARPVWHAVGALATLLVATAKETFRPCLRWEFSLKGHLVNRSALRRHPRRRDKTRPGSARRSARWAAAGAGPGETGSLSELREKLRGSRHAAPAGLTGARAVPASPSAAWGLCGMPRAVTHEGAASPPPFPGVPEPMQPRSCNRTPDPADPRPGPSLRRESVPRQRAADLQSRTQSSSLHYATREEKCALLWVQMK